MDSYLPPEACGTGQVTATAFPSAFRDDRHPAPQFGPLLAAPAAGRRRHAQRSAAGRRDVPDQSGRDGAPPLSGLLLLALLGSVGLLVYALAAGGGVWLALLAYSLGGSATLLAAAGVAALREARPRRAPRPAADFAFAGGVRHG